MLKKYIIAVVLHRSYETKFDIESICLIWSLVGDEVDLSGVMHDWHVDMI